MLELFQTEWCPSSRRVRQRLTELGVDYITHQVPVDRDERAVLVATSGADTIPTLLLEDGSTVVGVERILEYLDMRYDEAGDAEPHRLKAATMRRRYLDEECGCSPAATR